jgi:hypothetical protein
MRADKACVRDCALIVYYRVARQPDVDPWAFVKRLDVPLRRADRRRAVRLAVEWFHQVEELSICHTSSTT